MIKIGEYQKKDDYGASFCYSGYYDVSKKFYGEIDQDKFKEFIKFSF